MTSVTEEESTDESDTTESSYNSLAVSSVLSSSEYNTDDKLTPGLFNISISKAVRNNSVKKEISNQHSIKWGSGFGDKKIFNYKVGDSIAPPIFPYGSNPLPLRTKNVNSCAEGVDQTELSTDMSDTSSKCKDKTRNLNDNNNLTGSVSSQESSRNSSSDRTSSASETSNSRPFFPDLNSPAWYKAQCFDQYWSNYQFVMEWYNMHLRTVSKLSRQTGAGDAGQGQDKEKKHRSHRARKARQSRRARYRRRAKERFRNASKDSASVSESTSHTETASGSAVVSNEEMEMEVTDEMMQFFQTSLKHKIERDRKKESLDEKGGEASRVNIEQVVIGHQARSSSAPVEQPGLRRTAELKYLYGPDAPMIHGMETALQLTFDRVSDRHQPKLWPNMPLKITFA